jgi:hypothetical protein
MKSKNLERTGEDRDTKADCADCETFLVPHSVDPIFFYLLKGFAADALRRFTFLYSPIDVSG